MSVNEESGEMGGPPSPRFDEIGPSVGGAFPDILLKNQHGEQVDLHRARSGKAAIVVFFRSVDW